MTVRTTDRKELQLIMASRLGKEPLDNVVPFARQKHLARGPFQVYKVGRQSENHAKVRTSFEFEVLDTWCAGGLLKKFGHISFCKFSEIYWR